MSMSFGKTKAKNFGRVFKDNPKPLVQNAYLNFLRSYKAQHPDCGVKRVLQRGTKQWQKLTPEQQEEFTKNKVLPAVLEKRKADSNVTRYTLPKCKPLGYTKRSMNAEKNVQNSWRKVKHLPPKKGKKTPKIIRRGKRMDRSDGREGECFDLGKRMDRSNRTEEECFDLAMLCIVEENLDNKNIDIDDDNDDDHDRRDDLMDDEMGGDDDIDDDDDQGNDQRGDEGNDQLGDDGEDGDDGDDGDESDEEKYVYFVAK